jgi:hypothetical protein
MAIVEAAAHDERSVGSSEPTKRIGDNFRELDDVALAVSTFVPAIGRELLSGTRVPSWRSGGAARLTKSSFSHRSIASSPSAYWTWLRD